MTLLLYPLLFLPKIFLGFVIAHWLWKESDGVAILLKLAIGVPLGLAISASLFFIALSVGISPKLYSQVEFWSLLLFGIVWLAKNITLLKTIDWRSIKLSLPGHMTGYGRWPISALFILVIYAFLIGIVKEELLRQWWLPVLIIGQLAGYFCIYLVTPHDLQLHIKTSIDRLVSHVYPVLIFWLIAITRSPGLSFPFMISAKTIPPATE